MGITLGRGEVLLTRQSLHNRRRGTAAKKLSHKRVSQVVKPETEKPDALACALEGVPKRVLSPCSAVAWPSHVLLLRSPREVCKERVELRMKRNQGKVDDDAVVVRGRTLCPTAQGSLVIESKHKQLQ